MRKLFQQALVRLNKKELEELTTEVKETIFLETKTGIKQKTFTSAELWRIQSMKKPVVIRRAFGY